MLAARMAAAAQRNFAKTTLFAKFPRVSAQDVRTERYPINAGGLLRGTREQPPSRPLTKNMGNNGFPGFPGNDGWMVELSRTRLLHFPLSLRSAQKPPQPTPFLVQAQRGRQGVSGG